MAGEVHPPGAEANALRAKPPALDEGAQARAGRDASASSHDPVPWDPRPARGVQRPQRPPHGTRPARHTEERGDLPVRGDPSVRDPSHERVDALEEAVAPDPHRGGGASFGLSGGGVPGGGAICSGAACGVVLISSPEDGAAPCAGAA